MPSFIGNFEKKKVCKVKSISDQLPIEREADLRQKRKEILQRLKQNPEPLDSTGCCDERNSQSSSFLATEPPFSPVKGSTIFDDIQKPRTFSRTEATDSDCSKVLKQEQLLTSGQTERHRKLEETTNEKPGLKNHTTKSRIPIPSPSASPPRTHMKLLHGNKTEKKERLRGCRNNEISTGYIPSFSLGSDEKSDHKKRVSMIKRTVSKRNETINKKQLNVKDSSSKNSRNNGLPINNTGITNIPFINIERTATPSKELRKRVKSPEVTTTQTTESENRLVASTSLTSLRTSDAVDTYITRSLPLSPELARKQQTKLEEDFKRVEENLNQTFEELRKYVRTR